MSSAGTFEILATACLALAVLHTFLVGHFRAWAARYPEGSIPENLLHLLGEVEVVFGFWAGIFVLLALGLVGSTETIQYTESLSFAEPLFVFAIMAVAATKPILLFARAMIFSIASLLPLSLGIAVYFACLALGPLLGSFITEPAAMTVTALLLKDLYFGKQTLSQRAKYITLAVLLVNVSIGGVLTHFAAPPVLMVAGTWNWDLAFMFTHFGWKAMLAVFINAVGATVLLRSELKNFDLSAYKKEKLAVPAWLILIHGVFLGLIVMNVHNPTIFMGLFLYFLGVTAITREYQSELKLRESMLVAFFLAGLVALAGPQRWWLEPVLAQLDDLTLFLGATGLTAITDNAALTLLGSQVLQLADQAKYALVAGAVAGGGLTVIANAPNPIAFSVLQDFFGVEGIKPLSLLKWALVPTLVAMTLLWLLPT